VGDQSRKVNLVFSSQLALLLLARMQIVFMQKEQFRLSNVVNRSGKIVKDSAIVSTPLQVQVALDAPIGSVTILEDPEILVPAHQQGCMIS